MFKQAKAELDQALNILVCAEINFKGIDFWKIITKRSHNYNLS